MSRCLLSVSLSLLLVVAACSGDNSDYQAQRQEMVDAFYRDMADEEFAGLDLADESRCLAEGVVSAFSDSRFVELGLDTAATAASFDEVLDGIELTAGEEDEISKVISSCVDWEAFIVAGLLAGFVEEGISEESTRCIIESISEESIDAAADAMPNYVSAQLAGEEGSSEEDLVDAAMISIEEEMLGEMPRCLTPGELGNLG